MPDESDDQANVPAESLRLRLEREAKLRLGAADERDRSAQLRGHGDDARRTGAVERSEEHERRIRAGEGRSLADVERSLQVKFHELAMEARRRLAELGAVHADELERVADEREAVADERDKAANARSRTANTRDRAADERERLDDERERIADRREHAADFRDREADERDRAADERDRVADRREHDSVDRWSDDDS